MVIEQFKDGPGVLKRFKEQGRMMPEGVEYVASWIDPERARCFQVMRAENAELLQIWIDRWSDIVDFEIVPVVESSDYWSRFGSGSI
jgi:Protein of unknown function (DUF3303)